jgi:hypothetical protein
MKLDERRLMVALACEPGSTVGALAREIARMRRVITEYVNEVESGQKFDALCLLVPGLVFDDGVYDAVDPHHAVVAEWRAAKGVGT